MATTFNVIYLGNFADIDPFEGDNDSEDAGDLVGVTMGSAGAPLFNNIQEFSPGSTGFSGGNSSGSYDKNNSNSNDTFRIDGGPNQTMDGTGLYGLTVTFTDGTTADVTSVIFQDTAGETYLSPEISDNADNAALNSKPIESITITSLNGSSGTGMWAYREPGNFAVCYASGTRIQTPLGWVPIETLTPGDLILTADGGPQPVRWIGRRTAYTSRAFCPVRIRQGALGPGRPVRDLWVSP